jgi:predicted nucleic acid-binding protein
MIYFDTSALVKRFVEEPGSDVVRRFVLGEAPVATAKITYAEVYSGFTRKWKEGHLSSSDYDMVCRDFEADWDSYVRVELSDEILLTSRDVIRRHGLRGFDAIHLASAIHLMTALEERIDFAAADRRLLEAAEAEGLRSIDVEVGES